MSQGTILVIDDSATIRRLVDSCLSPAGYAVVLAGSAEEGIEKAAEVRPDLILLDHQLPGTTGIEVCRRLLEHDDLKNIPVIASSTLRKRAYMEYGDCPNVVDMLPKPYTPDLLLTTVVNTLDTGSLVIDSQRDGTAVPEVIQELAQIELSGGFQYFDLREVLDFLNNGDKQGVLEVEQGNNRIWIFVAQGRVQAVTASGMNVEEAIERLPESLQELAPVLRLTVGGGSCAQVEGLVQLLDNKVLDPRLLRKLLRHQASYLLWSCFRTQPSVFRFEPARQPPALHRRLALDVSVAALLVEAALATPEEEFADSAEELVYSRRAIRGQNLDRAGLTALQQKIFTHVGDGRTAEEIAEEIKDDVSEVRRVLYGFCLADLLEAQPRSARRNVVVLETDSHQAIELRAFAQSTECPCHLKVVRDRLSLMLVLKRQQADVIVLALDSDAGRTVAEELRSDDSGQFEHTAWIGLGDQGHATSLEFDASLGRPYDIDQLLRLVQTVQRSTAEETLASVG